MQSRESPSKNFTVTFVVGCDWRCQPGFHTCRLKLLMWVGSPQAWSSKRRLWGWYSPGKESISPLGKGKFQKCIGKMGWLYWFPGAPGGIHIMFDISREKHYLHSFFSFQFSVGIWVSILSEYPHLIVLPAWPLPCNSSCFPTMTWPYFVSSLGARLFTSPLAIQSIHEIHLAVILPEQTAKRLWNKSLRYVCPTILSNLLGGWTTPLKNMI